MNSKQLMIPILSGGLGLQGFVVNCNIAHYLLQFSYYSFLNPLWRFSIILTGYIQMNHGLFSPRIK